MVYRSQGSLYCDQAVTLFEGNKMTSSDTTDESVNSSVLPPRARPGKPGGKRDQNRKERIRVLQEAALVLFLEQGLSSTTIDEITKAAGTAKGNFTVTSVIKRTSFGP